MSEPLEPKTCPPLTCSVEDSPVRTLAPQDDGPGLSSEHAADSGSSTAESFASYDPATSSWRTSQLCLLSGSTLYSESWPRAGMMRNGTVFRRPPSAPLTRGTESSWWPTPRATMWHGGDILAQINGTPSAMRRFPSGARTMWPTPVVAMHKGSSLNAMTRKTGASRANDRLDYATEEGIVANGRLNPQWVEWLMGFPSEWTVSRPSEMPSSPKSLKSSGG